MGKRSDAADKRDDEANVRDDVANQRDITADERDCVANEREQAANERDAEREGVLSDANSADAVLERVTSRLDRYEAGEARREERDLR